MTLNWRAIWTIVGKDLRLLRMNKNVLATLVILPIIMLVIVPGAMVYLAASGSNPEVVDDFSEDFDLFFAGMPEGIRAEVEVYDTISQRLVLLISAYLFAPLFLMGFGCQLERCANIALVLFVQRHRHTLKEISVSTLDKRRIAVGHNY